MRLVYCGSPLAAVAPLVALVEAGHDVVLVVTTPDRRRARGPAVLPTPVKIAAEQLGLAVSHELSDIEAVPSDLGIVVAYGRLIPASYLEHLSLLNVHFSLLPRWRGAAPVERAILAGDELTGVCVMGLEPTLDTGPIYAMGTTRIDDKDATQLTSELSELGARLLVSTLAESPRPVPIAQSGEITYAKKLTPADFALDPLLDGDMLKRIVRLTRAVANVNGRRLRIESAFLNDDGHNHGGVIELHGDAVGFGSARGWLEVTALRPEGRSTMTASQWGSGARLDSLARWSRVGHDEP